LTVRVDRLRDITAEDVRRLIVGYESQQRYEVHWSESHRETSITLELVDLDRPFVKRWHHERLTDWYRSLLREGLSSGAWDSDRLIGIAITERREWNDEAMVWELHVDETHRGRGAGRRLLQSVEASARRSGCRAVVIETQTTNVAAIAFYRACGYRLQGIDLSFYGNDDLDRGEVAVFMKKAL
jgi:ribosomal protein S18 acetylase RimI-like enzyme